MASLARGSEPVCAEPCLSPKACDPVETTDTSEDEMAAVMTTVRAAASKGVEAVIELMKDNQDSPEMQWVRGGRWCWWGRRARQGRSPLLRRALLLRMRGVAFVGA